MNRIDELRKKQNKSYSQIAKETGLTTAYIFQLAKEKRSNPTLEVMQKIANALGQKVERVFQLNK